MSLRSGHGREGYTKIIFKLHGYFDRKKVSRIYKSFKRRYEDAQKLFLICTDTLIERKCHGFIKVLRRQVSLRSGHGREGYTKPYQSTRNIH